MALTFTRDAMTFHLMSCVGGIVNPHQTYIVFCCALLCLVYINNPHWLYMMYLTIFFRIITLTLVWFSQWTVFISMEAFHIISANSELSSYHEYFREHHWKSMELAEISRITLQVGNFNIGQTDPFEAGLGYKNLTSFVPHRLGVPSSIECQAQNQAAN